METMEKSAERMAVKSTNRSRNDSDLPLRQPTDQKAGGSNPSRRTNIELLPIHTGKGFGVNGFTELRELLGGGVFGFLGLHIQEDIPYRSLPTIE
ncbi:hypothetical protein [Intestinimonas sp. MSJ-38]|uniref:hypothetical protein n=1 Tax=Intestinimonas sp. MSJ-38 TaxID=2841532 RepID=UPI001C10A633|nr:hypothetical protein [Intestinimonas sp. MSJ-38]MBU5433228.1 hypothetical protein [Intestinimonas sp. MSJ-38]